MKTRRYDQACRYAAKLDAVGLLCWLVGETPAELRFRTWLDARTLPWPGDPERTCDTVAWLGDADPAVEWAVPVEFCLEPDGELFGRLLVYLGQLWHEKRPTDGRGEHFAVGAVVVNLTGRGHTSRDMQLRQTGVRTMLGVAECDLAHMDAATTLDGIAAATIAPCVLSWIPLMQNGAEAAIIQQWLELARREPEAKRRSDYGGLALVFAEAADRRHAWEKALEGWNVTDSQVIQEWIAQGEVMGEVKGQATALLRLLARRFPPGLPAEVAAVIRGATDVAQLQRWFDLAVDADSLETFRRAAGL
jgi:hypothetical protein